MAKTVRKRGPGAQIVKVEVGPFKEISALPGPVFEQLKRLVDLGGTYTVVSLLELGIEEASRREADDDEADYNDYVGDY